METTILAIPWGYKEATILIHSFFPSRPERTCEFEENEHGFEGFFMFIIALSTVFVELEDKLRSQDDCGLCRL